MILGISDIEMKTNMADLQNFIITTVRNVIHFIFSIFRYDWTIGKKIGIINVDYNETQNNCCYYSYLITSPPLLGFFTLFTLLRGGILGGPQ